MTGILNIDKPEGKSSAYAVNVVKRVSKRPCGHFGTLDPFATGVLLVGLGNANRLFDYFLGKKKSYTARFRFGATTDTLDPEGELVMGGGTPTKEQILEVLPNFTGEIMQVPPAFSAKSVGGERSYKLARRGEAPALAAKKVRVDEFALLGQTGEGEYEFSVTCGAGVYIRALARDLAAALGTLGYCTRLRRTACGPFSEKEAVPLHLLTPENIGDYLVQIDSVLPFPRLDEVDERFFSGVRTEVQKPDGLYKIYRDGVFYGTGAVEGGVLRPDKKLC